MGDEPIRKRFLLVHRLPHDGLVDTSDGTSGKCDGSRQANALTDQAAPAKEGILAQQGEHCFFSAPGYHGNLHPTLREVENVISIVAL